MKNNLYILREEKDLLEKDIAKILNISPSVYCEWEQDKLSIPTKRLYELANLFEVNIDYLVNLTSKRENIKTKEQLNSEKIAYNVKQIRLELGLSMRALAKMLNTSSSAISNYENNKNIILSSFLIELAKISNYSLDYILNRSNKKYLS